MGRYLGTIACLSIGRYGLAGLGGPSLLQSSQNGGLGPFQACDVGKRVYDMGGGVWQMENDDQRAARLGAVRWRVTGGDSTAGALHAANEPFTVEVTATTTTEAHEKARAARYAAGREHVHISRAEPMPGAQGEDSTHG